MTELPSKIARRNALDRFDLYGSERTFQIVWLLLAAFFILFVWGFVQLADFSNRVHVLIFFSLLSTYVPMLIGLALLWGHVSRSTRLVLKAIDLATRKEGPVETAHASDPFRPEPDPKSRLWL
ncbi:MAG TPA: hypothetical protein VHY84_01285 [Bryobacteraceae bacterium]|jgi:hypothetical protein|nr:hypothetical protein [Bryobacteraceae bacterium]